MTTESRVIDYPSLEVAECPYPLLARLRSDGGVYKVPGREEYLISRHEDIVFVAQHPEIFSSSTPLNAEAQKGWEASVFSSDPPAHTEKRKIAFGSFTPGKLKGYEPMIQSLVDELIDGFIETGAVEFVSQFSNLLSSRVMFNILGLPVEESAWIAEITFEGIGARYLPPDLRAAQDRDGLRVHECMAAAVAERIAEPRDDVISDLIRAYIERDGSADPAYLTVESAVLLLGGVMTPANMMSSAMTLLMQHPDQAALVLADHARIPQMLEETLRIESPDQFMPRYATVDAEIAGVPIPAGSLVLLLYASGNRDQAMFEDPERFDVQRPNFKRHVAFGNGIHFCLGAPLARMQGKHAFETLFTRLRNIRLADGKNDFTHLESLFNRGPRALHLEFDRA